MLDIVVRHGPVSSMEPSEQTGCIYSALARGEAIQTPLSTIYSLLSTLSQPSPDGQRGQAANWGQIYKQTF